MLWQKNAKSVQQSDLKIQINSRELAVGATKSSKTFMLLFCILLNLPWIWLIKKKPDLFICVEPASPLKSKIVWLLITQEKVFCRVGENQYQFNPVKVGDVFSCLLYIPMFSDWNNSHKNAPGPLISFVRTGSSLQYEKWLQFLVN